MIASSSYSIVFVVVVEVVVVGVGEEFVIKRSSVGNSVDSEGRDVMMGVAWVSLFTTPATNGVTGEIGGVDVVVVVVVIVVLVVSFIYYSISRFSSSELSAVLYVFGACVVARAKGSVRSCEKSGARSVSVCGHGKKFHTGCPVSGMVDASYTRECFG